MKVYMHLAFARHIIVPAHLHCVYACMHCCARLSHTLIFMPDSVGEPLTPLTPPTTRGIRPTCNRSPCVGQAQSNACCSLCYKPSHLETVTFFCKALPLTQTIVQCTQPCINSNLLGRTQALRLLLRIVHGVNVGCMHFGPCISPA